MQAVNSMPKMHSLEFGGDRFFIVGDAALFWPRHQALLIADLHLEKASSYAAMGQMLPPYDSFATLTALSKLIDICGACWIISLGDNFHDSGGEYRMPSDAAVLLSALIARHRWTWIAGNHDPVSNAIWGGETQEELPMPISPMDSIMLRHQAVPGWPGFEISGHYHPKMRIKTGLRNVSRRCFTISQRKIIMPAFGVLTGGMDAGEAALLAEPALRESGGCEKGGAQALIALPQKLVRFPLNP